MDAPHTEITAVRFRVQTDADRARDSHTIVRVCELFAGDTPVAKGPYDPHMGSTDPRYSCTSCGLSSKLCAGHPGHVDLPFPVVLPYAVPEIRRWLRVACLHCGAIVVNLGTARGQRILKMAATVRLAQASTLPYEGVPCPNCTRPHPKVSKFPDDHFSFQVELPSVGGGTRPRFMYAYQVRTVLERISDESVRLMGRDPATTHPRNLIMTVLQVPPVSIRPGIRLSGPAGHGASCHDINNILQYIIKSAGAAPPFDYERAIGREPPKEVADSMTGLQELVFNLIYGAGVTNNSRGNGKRGVIVGGRPAVSIGRRWPRKAGRIRRHLFGTRCWVVSRNTISGKSMIDPESVGIPESFARALQIEEVVQPNNITWLMQFFLNGRRQYPGASRVRRASTDTVHDVEGLLRTGQMLEVGDRLWRDVITGDCALFNRQPSLTRSAIGLHRVVVMRSTSAGDDSGLPHPPEEKSTQFNVLSTPLYNADFDGDEMNLIPLSQPGPRAECLVLASVAGSFISTKNSRPVIGMVQDSVIGSCLLSLVPKMNKIYAMSIFENSGLAPPDLSHMRPDDTISGRELISILLAATPINLSRRPSWYSELAVPYMHFAPEDTHTRIERGRLVSGVLDKATVGDSAGGGVFHKISRSFNPREAIRVMSALQRMTINLLDQRGFTVSFADMIMPDETNEKIQKIVADMRRESEAITERLLDGQIVPPLGMTTHDYYERLQREALKAPDEILGPIYSSMDMETNGFYQMIAAGSKGNPKNVINVSGSVTQIIVRDRRIEAHGGGIGRTLAYYQNGDTSPEASGFVPGCYANGLTAAGHYMGSIIGRNDLTNKALTTAVTGYDNRKSIMALQSCIVGPMRETWGPGLAQALYGDDGMDARQIEQVPYPIAAMSNKELRESFKIPSAASQPKWVTAEIDQLIADRDHFRQIFLDVERSDFSNLVPSTIPLAVNVESIAQEVFGGRESATEPSLADLETMHKMVTEFCSKLVYLLLNHYQEQAGNPAPPHMSAATEMLRRIVRASLGSRKLHEHKATPELLLALFDAIRMRYQRSLIAPGEAVGVLASQAVSEPLTQYMLDSHHRSVSGGTSKAGIERPHEIFSARGIKDEKTPEMLIRGLAPDETGKMVITSDRAILQELADSIKVLSLSQVAMAWDILLEPFIGGRSSKDDQLCPDFAEDVEWVDEFIANTPLPSTPSDLSFWCVRIQLSRIGLMMKSITLESVVSRLRMMCPFAHFVHSPEGRIEKFPDPIMRVYLRASVFSRGSKKTLSSFVPSATLRAAIKAAERKIPKGNRSDAERLAESIFMGMFNAPIRGVPGITDARVEKIARHGIDDDGKLVRINSEHAIRTTGTNLPGILMYEAVDADSVVTSSIGDTIATLGIEAGRARIIMEIGRIMGSRQPSKRHLQIYADQMTRTGTFTSLEYGGIKKREPNNVLLRAGTHGPLGVLVQAPLDKVENRLYGMAAPMMLGSVPRLGTNSVELIVDKDFVSKNRKSTHQILDDL